MRYEIAFLNEAPSRILVGDGNLTREHSEWLQHRDMWSAFFYHHTNAVTIATQTYAVNAGDIVFFPPGKRCANARTGKDTWFDFLTFSLPSTEGFKVAIPHLAQDMDRILPDLRRASNRIVDTRVPSVAFVWNLLWSVGQNLSVFRGLEVMYEAEAYILKHLDQKISIPAMCEAVKVSQRRLLTAFRAEHGVAIQEYIVQKRIQEASRLLLTTDMPIKELAGKVGFFDLQHFNKTMRSATGQSPTAFRTLARAEEAEKDLA